MNKLTCARNVGALNLRRSDIAMFDGLPFRVINLFRESDECSTPHGGATLHYSTDIIMCGDFNVCMRYEVLCYIANHIEIRSKMR